MANCDMGVCFNMSGRVIAGRLQVVLGHFVSPWEGLHVGRWVCYSYFWNYDFFCAAGQKTKGY